MNKLVEELKDLELGDSWIQANALHKNFYEGKLIPELTEKYMEDAKKLTGDTKIIFKATPVNLSIFIPLAPC